MLEMGLFDKKERQNKVQSQRPKKLELNELSENTLLNVAGGRDFHTEADEEANRVLINEIVR